jgi:hypothetical protein
MIVWAKYSKHGNSCWETIERLRAEVARLTQERDEARQSRDGWHKTADRIAGERDKADEQIKQLHSRLIANARNAHRGAAQQAKRTDEAVARAEEAEAEVERLREALEACARWSRTHMIVCHGTFECCPACIAGDALAEPQKETDDESLRRVVEGLDAAEPNEETDDA